jgi:hypothetical protein
MNGVDLLAFTILAWPLIAAALYVLRSAGRALYQAARTHTRSTR